MEAFLSFQDKYFNDSRRLSPEKDQYLSILLGELSMRLDNQAEATYYFQQAAVPKGGLKYLTEQALDRIVKINSSRRRIFN